VHGEPEAAAALRVLLVNQLGWNVAIPKYQDVYELNTTE
jgi:hypothetical protein